MSTKKDKQKVLDEVWTEQRVKDFLNIEAADDSDRDFHVLLKAYQSMRIENFEQFIDFFKAAGRNLQARNEEGKTVSDIIATHRHGKPYLTALNR